MVSCRLLLCCAAEHFPCVSEPVLLLPPSSRTMYPPMYTSLANWTTTDDV